jgi:hypothetical protein
MVEQVVLVQFTENRYNMINYINTLRKIKILTKTIDEYNLKKNTDLILLDNIEEKIFNLRIEFSKQVEAQIED